MKKVSPEKGARVSISNTGGAPTDKRGCRDVFFLLIFLIVWAGMGFVAYYAFTFGDINKIYYGSDSNGYMCGRDYAGGPYLGNKTNLYYFNPLSPTSPAVCLFQCPTNTTIASISNVICQTGVNITGSNDVELAADLANKIKTKKCAFGTIATKSVLNRCIPSDTAFVKLALNDSSMSDITGESANILFSVSDTGMTVLQDLKSSWNEIAIALAISLGAAIIWLFLLRFTSGIVVWTIILAACSGLVGLSVYLYFEWQKVLKNNDAAVFKVGDEDMTAKAYMGFFIATSVIAGITLLVSLTLFKRIKIAVQLLKEASRALVALPSLIFVPISIFVITLGWIIFYVCGVVLLYVVDMNKVKEVNSALAIENINFYLQWYWLFGFLWVFFFLQAVNQTAIAGAVAQWYFTRDKKQIPFFTVGKSLWRCFRYHLGSLAFGSLILAIVYFIRVVLVYIERQVKGSKNKAAQFILKCLQCCFACLARFLSFLNKNAYIMISITGYSFCKSAKTAFSLLVRNALRLVAIDTVSSLIILFSKLLIAAAGSFYYYIRITDREDLSFVVLPVLVVFLGSYFVAGVFLYVYDMTIDTIFICFCEDCDLNERSGDYFMSDRLKTLVDRNSLKK